MYRCESDEESSIEINGIEDSFKSLSQDAKTFYLGRSVAELSCLPESPLQFFREWVSGNKPVVFRNAISHWPAFSLWQSNDYFREKIGDLPVTVSVTPTGYADAAVFNVDTSTFKFVMPFEEEMSMNTFLDVIENPASKNGVHYIQRQNSNLTGEFVDLLNDTSELNFAREAFGKQPDAVNFWMGDSRAVTSTHKDPYENIYCVVRGYKDFILFPPTDLPWLSYENCSQAAYEKQSDGTFVIKDLPDLPQIPWIVTDPLAPDYEKYPEFRHATAYRVRVKAGDVLYLPSLWFHHLRQSHGCVAVNFWYDMDFDIKWNYFQFLSNVAKLSQKMTSE